MSSNDTGNDFYGPIFWTALHVACANLEKGKEKDLMQFIDAIGKIYPCEKCRNHFNEKRKIVDPKKYLGSGREMLMWSYIMHDMVNVEKLANHIPNAKASPNFSDVEKKYSEVLGKKDLVTGEDISSEKPKSRRSNLRNRNLAPPAPQVISTQPTFVNEKSILSTPTQVEYNANQQQEEQKKIIPKRGGCARCGGKNPVV